ncbi:conserved hypothetical protein [Vibrio phage 121E34-1]|nr:conserved hypothetical protein [Vibrio phage 121E34-1]CAH9012443.1 conserved hypothetical protein [Vibrio phage 131E34-1]
MPIHDEGLIMAAVRRKRGEASLGINQREALWKDIVLAAKGGTEESPVSEKEKLAAQRIVADRLWAKLKPVSQRMTLDLPKDATMEVMLQTLVSSAMTGKCDPEQATEMIKAIGAAYSVKANNEIAERFKQMEDEFTEFLRWKVTQDGGDEVTHSV